MTEQAVPKRQNGIFPDSWVVGTAAAELARHDPGVLLDRIAPVEEVDVDVDGTGRAPCRMGSRRPSAEEIEELRRVMRRLEEDFAASRARQGHGPGVRPVVSSLSQRAVVQRHAAARPRRWIAWATVVAALLLAAALSARYLLVT